jgi:NitT/TauT family transport system substrate-binding protein
VHDYTVDDPDEVAKWYVENLKPNLSLEDLTADLGSIVCHDHPVGEALVEQIRVSIVGMQLIKIIDPDTDAKALANRIVVNVLA